MTCVQRTLSPSAPLRQTLSLKGLRSCTGARRERLNRKTELNRVKLTEFYCTSTCPCRVTQSLEKVTESSKVTAQWYWHWLLPVAPMKLLVLKSSARWEQRLTFLFVAVEQHRHNRRPTGYPRVSCIHACRGLVSFEKGCTYSFWNTAMLWRYQSFCMSSQVSCVLLQWVNSAKELRFKMCSVHCFFPQHHL